MYTSKYLLSNTKNLHKYSKPSCAHCKWLVTAVSRLNEQVGSYMIKKFQNTVIIHQPLRIPSNLKELANTDSSYASTCWPISRSEPNISQQMDGIIILANRQVSLLALSTLMDVRGLIVFLVLQSLVQ